jgi:hypothetical protein
MLEIRLRQRWTKCPALETQKRRSFIPVNALDLIRNFQEIGARYELIGDGFDMFAPRGTVTLEMRELLKCHKTEMVTFLQQTKGEDSEIIWRIEAMRLQLTEDGKPFPTLFARHDISPKLGECFSCSERLREFESGYCCGLCSRAKHILLEVA